MWRAPTRRKPDRFFDRFKSAPPFHDDTLGVLEWSGTAWGGSITLPNDGELALAIDGRDEAQRVAERQADEPVSGEIPNHRRPRVAQAAQDACGDTLEAVEKLEDRTDVAGLTRAGMAATPVTASRRPTP